MAETVVQTPGGALERYFHAPLRRLRAAGVTPFEVVTVVVMTVLVLWFVLAPVLNLFYGAFQSEPPGEGGVWTLEHFRVVFGNPGYWAHGGQNPAGRLRRGLPGDDHRLAPGLAGREDRHARKALGGAFRHSSFLHQHLRRRARLDSSGQPHQRGWSSSGRTSHQRVLRLGDHLGLGHIHGALYVSVHLGGARSVDTTYEEASFMSGAGLFPHPDAGDVPGHSSPPSSRA